MWGKAISAPHLPHTKGPAGGKYMRIAANGKGRISRRKPRLLAGFSG